jgi:hypothetical protein
MSSLWQSRHRSGVSRRRKRGISKRLRVPHCLVFMISGDAFNSSYGRGSGSEKDQGNGQSSWWRMAYVCARTHPTGNIASWVCHACWLGEAMEVGDVHSSVRLRACHNTAPSLTLTLVSLCWNRGHVVACPWLVILMMTHQPAYLGTTILTIFFFWEEQMNTTPIWTLYTHPMIPILISG